MKTISGNARALHWLLFPMLLVLIASKLMAAPSEWYAQVDSNLIELNKLARSKGNTENWTREGDTLVVKMRYDETMGAKARTDIPRLQRILLDEMTRRLCDPNARWIDLLALGFVVAARAYDQKGQLTEVTVRMSNCR